MPTFAREGLTIAFEEAGAGEPVLLLQGIGVAGNGWRPQLDGLADRFHLVAPDNRGIGGSAPGEVSIEAMAADAFGLMDHLGWDRAHVVGHSMGGVIAQQLALDAPSRVKSLSLLCTFHRATDATAMRWFMFQVGVRMRVGTRRMRRHAFLEMILTPTQHRTADKDALAAEYAVYFGRDLAETPGIVMQQVGAMRRHDVSARLGELAGVPTLVLSGAEDRVALPETGERLAAAIGAARYHRMDDAAHGLTITHAATLNPILAEHWSGASRRAEVSRAG